jgi:hypothetical protein
VIGVFEDIVASGDVVHKKCRPLQGLENFGA